MTLNAYDIFHLPSATLQPLNSFGCNAQLSQITVSFSSRRVETVYHIPHFERLTKVHTLQAKCECEECQLRTEV